MTKKVIFFSENQTPPLEISGYATELMRDFVHARDSRIAAFGQIKCDSSVASDIILMAY